MNEKTDAVRTELNAIIADVKNSFGDLDPAQLNWKPAADSWSIAQCLEHLILSNEEMSPLIEAKLRGEPNSFFEKISPFSGFFGGFLKKSLMKDSKKFKAPTKAIVPPSEIDGEIVERFCQDQEKIIGQLDAIGKLDLDRTILTSPFLRIMTYRLADGLDIMVEHEKRHVRQAKRVMETPAFPA